jgi:NAD(P)-dependent dehydrogenase (short-subunit alcohol dehydrogenase family)
LGIGCRARAARQPWAPGGRAAGQPDVAARLFEARIPLSQHACAEEIAQCVLFLACADSSFMTGATVPVDGGMHI